MSCPRWLRWATLPKRLSNVRDALSNPSYARVVTGELEETPPNPLSSPAPARHNS